MRGSAKEADGKREFFQHSMLSANAYLVKHQDATRALAEKLKAVHSESKVSDLNVSFGSLYSTCCEIWVVVCGECAF